VLFRLVAKSGQGQVPCAAVALLSVIGRAYAPSMQELRALPGGSGLLRIADGAMAVQSAAPVFIVVLLGCGWAIWSAPTLLVLLRSVLLVSVLCIAAMGSIWLSGQLWVRVRRHRLAVQLPEGLPLGLVLALRFLAARGEETMLRLFWAILVSWFVGSWIYADWQPAERAAGLVLVAGIAGYGINGMLHIISEARAARRQLIDALPVSPASWRRLAWSVPLCLHAVLLSALYFWAIHSGADVTSIAIAATISAGIAILSLLTIDMHPANGGIVACLYVPVGARIAGAIA
jgi:hypothetical protein